MPRPALLSDQLRGFLLECPKSRYQLAQETGLSQAVLSRFATGKRVPSVKTLNALGQALNLVLSESHWSLTRDEMLAEAMKKTPACLQKR